MKPETRADFSLFVQGQHMPALLIDWQIVTAIGGQVFGANRTVFKVNHPPKSLHRGEKFGMQRVIGRHHLKDTGNCGADRRKNNELRLFAGYGLSN